MNVAAWVWFAKPLARNAGCAVGVDSSLAWEERGKAATEPMRAKMVAVGFLLKRILTLGVFGRKRKRVNERVGERVGEKSK